MPLYQLDILMSELGRIEARALRRDIQAATSPHLKAADRRAMLRRLDKAASVPAPETPPPTPGTHDPAAAAAWFAARGVRTV
jgi:hypothetical protein